MASFDDLTPERAVQYVQECTSIFSSQDQLQVLEINQADGEGYVNHLYKVWNQNGRTVVIKQAKPYLSFVGADTSIPVSVERNRIEADAYRIRSAIVPQYLLEILHKDPDNNLFIQEYSASPSLRMQLRNGLEFPHFPRLIGEYIARSSFYTSEIFLDQSAHKLLEAKFTNSGMRRIMEGILFEFAKFGTSEDIAKFLQTHHDFLPGLQADKQLLMEILALRDIFMKKSECLAHGDLHTSNILIAQNNLVVFDMEYAHIGAFSGDIGYLCGNLIFPYVGWLFRYDKTEEERDRYRRTLLSYISEIVDTFVNTFRNLWACDAKPIYKNTPEYMELLFKDLISEVAGFMGTQGFTRVVYHSGVQDFELIKSKQNLEKARALIIVISSALIKQRRNLHTIDQVLRLIEGVTHDFLQTFSRLDSGEKRFFNAHSSERVTTHSLQKELA